MRTAEHRRKRSLERFAYTIPLVGMMLTAPSLFAVNPKLSLDQYLHTSWTQEEGTPLPPVNALAQTNDGYLWLGSNKGLMRFDGMRFTDWTPSSGPGLPSLSIGWIWPAAGGGLWVGTRAGLCRIVHGHVVRYPALEKLPCPIVNSVLEDRPGRLWLISSCPNSNALARLSEDGRLQTFGPADGLPSPPIRLIDSDKAGPITYATTKAICQWAPGRQAECSAGDPLQVVAAAVAGDQSVVVADHSKDRIFRVSSGQLTPLGPPIANVSFTRAMLCDRDGNIWVGTSGQGLLRIRGDRVDRYTHADGLSHDLITSLIEDHEGDIWVATARGVDRIRDPKVQLYSDKTGLSNVVIDTVYGGRDGDIWIGTAGGGLNRLAGDNVTVYGVSNGLPSATVLSSYEDRTGALWVATIQGLAVLRGGRASPVLTADHHQLEHVFNITGESDGTVWMADSKLGVFAARGGVARPTTVPVAHSEDIVSLLAAPNGAIWLGHQGGGVTILCKSSTREYGSRDGLGSGPVRALIADRGGNIWAGTGDGLSRFRDSRWTTWTSARGLPEGGVRGIIEDKTGDLWLLTPAGVLRVSPDSLDSTDKPLQFTLYGAAEGLRLGNSMANPRLTRSLDGRIWVCTEDGVAAIDPTRLTRNPVPPPVAIEQVIADGRTYDPESDAEIGFRGHDLQIVYTGVSLMAPERVRFRYRLERLSRDWTEAGTRRNVAYMNLPPGHYLFHVIACNNDDYWNDTGAELKLRVDPYFYQTTWFAALCVAFISLAIWSAHRLKVQRVVSGMQLIQAERVRFGRELHDSLLQGFSGVVFLLEAVVRHLDNAPNLAKAQLDRAVEQADQSLREARELIFSLRIPALENNTLAEALRTTIAEMASAAGVEFEFELEGRPQKAAYNVEANLFLLAREAVRNALQHASPKRIRVELSYTLTDLRLTIQDDGRGFDPEIAITKLGHWGFRGMRERARLIGAQFTVDSAPGRGTTIGVTADWKK